ncbi:hypothetical protein ABS767_10880 [Sphingomonas sp. ST-64]|uniref:Uncharacterized protein n=1 Tax=Sphingomonas plantiphila TaxID=3163295 RepID=A0ABW8YMF9_9SPHN
MAAYRYEKTEQDGNKLNYQFRLTVGKALQMSANIIDLWVEVFPKGIVGTVIEKI